MRITFFIAVFCSTLVNSLAQTIVVKPYLQNAEPTSIKIMWETSLNGSSEVDYGLTNTLGTTVSGTSITGNGNSRVHTVELTGLQPATKYYYKTRTENFESSIYHFKTPPLKSSNASFNIVAMSDMQQWSSYPTVFNDIVDDNLIPYIQQNYGADLSEHLAYFAVPGDLVQTGSNYGSWASTFFQPAENLLSYVPLYPVPGNHEQNTPYFFQYFDLPMNGTMTNDYPEHWWFKDYSNVRLIGLESNGGYRVQAQLDWLQTVLDDAATDEHIDFVFAQLHHPYRSELWIAGNTDYTGDVIELLENFSTSSGKPSVHFFGHTHGYSRGQSKEHNHVMVNVASAGGAIDNWGEFAQQDYPEYSRSDDDFGYVLMEIQAGANPQFLLKRLSHGSIENGLVTNVLKDTLLVKFNNPSPDKPTGIFPSENDILTPDCITFLASEFNDSEGDLHGATQWRIATDANFSTVVYDEWYQHENWYYDVDLEAGNNMVDQVVTSLDENTTYYWQVRYRDRSLAWSEWSDAIMFQTSNSNLTPNLLANNGAEDGTTNWIETEGAFEAISSGECAGNNAFAGTKLFAVGGVCEDNAYGQGHQDVDVSSYASAINQGGKTVNFGGYLSDYNGSDRPAFKLEMLDNGGGFLAATPTYGNQTSDWTLMNETAPIPIGTSTLRMILSGTRNAGADNDSYFDEMFVRLNLSESECEEFVSVGIEQVQIQEIQTFPNPTFNSINWNGINAESAEFYDVSGRLVMNAIRPNGSLDISELTEGIYHLKLLSTKGIFVSKVVKSE